MANSNVIYYEPNYTHSFSNGNGERVMMPPPLENYCVIADLEVAIPSRPIHGIPKHNDVSYVIRYASSMDGNNSVSFFRGKTFADVDASFLTTEPTEFGTFADINKTNGTTTEMFGINSIDIEYNNYTVPIVTIKFTDIRGLSLFASEDLRNNKTIDGIKNCANPNIAGSFFKCFFTFPYPKFKLRVKGFYGSPVCYELTCSDFRAAFESSTGNFSATAKFVGYSFSVLNDLTLASLLSTPDSLYYGSDHWAASDYRFDDGSLIPKFSVLLKNIEKSTKEISKISDEEGLNISSLGEQANNISSMIEAHNTYFDAITNKLNELGKKFVEDRTSKRLVTCFSDTQLQSLSNDGGTLKIDLSQEYGELKKIFDSSALGGGFSLPQKFGDNTTNPLLQASSEWEKFDVGELEKDSKKPYAYSYNGKKFHESLVKLLNEKQNELSKEQESFQQLKQDKITDYIGFKPTVKNITDLVLAHVDTLLSEIYYCASNASVGEFRYENGKEGPYAFPEIIKKVTEGNITKNETSWTGEYDSNASETQLVNSLIEATNKVIKGLDETVNSIGEIESDKRESVEIPLTISDLFGKSSPFSGVDIDSFVSFCEKIAIRASILDRIYEYKDEDDFEKFGTSDAINFISSNKDNITEKFKTTIAQNGSWTIENIYQFLTTGKKVSVIPEGSTIPWKGAFFQGEHNTPFGNKHFFYAPIGNFSWEDINLAKKEINDSLNNVSDIKTILESSNQIKNIIDSRKDMLFTRGFGQNDNTFKIVEDYQNYNTSEKHGDLKIFNFTIDSSAYYHTYFGSDAKNSSLYKKNRLEDNDKSLKNVESVDGVIEKLFGENRTDAICDYYFMRTRYQGARNSTNMFVDLFWTKRFYEKCSTDEERAAFFLMSISNDYKFNGFIDYLEKEYDVIYAPKLYLVILGCQAKFHDTKFFVDNDNIMITELDDELIESSCDIKETLIQLYESWYEKSWPLYKKYFIPQWKFITKDNMPPLENISDGFKNLSYDEQRSSWRSFLQNYVNDDYINNISTFNEVFSITHFENEATQRLAEEYFTPCFVLNNCGSNGVKSDYEHEIDYDKIKKYIHGFIVGLRENLPEQTIGEKKQEMIVTAATNKQVCCALYQYLKLIWDKWLSGNPLDNGKHKWNYKSFRKRWHYIDSFYNHLTDKAIVDVFAFAKDVKNAYDVPGASAISTLSTTYARNKFVLFCVQNFLSMSDPSKMEKIFTAIPYKDVQYDPNDEIPDFVIMYTNEPSSKIGTESIDDCGDSFFISGGDDKPLPIPISTKDLTHGLKIPAFGVTYGEQYQSYFKDIQINMENPQVTDVSLQAQFKIAQAASGDENGSDVYSLGQNLFTIYSNMSFTCNVSMMGCAWIQPLMYFQLNNIPMFSGTYLIQKVTHNLAQGDMTTSFIGTRLSSKSTPFAENGLVSSRNNQTSLPSYNAVDYNAKRASIDNDCNYKFFLPIVGKDGVGMPQQELNMTLSEYSEKYGQWKITGITTDDTVLDFLSWTLLNEASVLDDLGKKQTCGVIFNKYVHAGYNLVESFFNNKQHACVKPEIWDNFSGKDQYRNIVTEIFTKTPIVLVGEETYVKRQVPIWNFNQKSGSMTESKTITEHDVKSMDAYCTVLGYDSNYSRQPKDEGRLEPEPPNVWTNGEYLFQHDNKNRLGHVISSVGTKPGYKAQEYWQLKPKKSQSDQNPSEMAKSVFESLKKTIDYSDGIKINDLQLIKTKSKDEIVIKASSGKEMAQVFDILLNTYYDYVYILYWVSKNNTCSDDPMEIRVKVTDDASTTSKHVGIVGKDLKPLNQTDGLNELFIKSIKKKYGNLDDNKNTFKMDCKNFTSITSKQNWKDEIRKIFDTVKLSSCFDSNFSGNSNIESTKVTAVTSNNTKIVYSFDGSLYTKLNSDKANLNPPKTLSSDEYDYLKAAEHAYNKACENYKENSTCGGVCATRVREAMTAVDGGGFKKMDGNQPNSACVYVKHLPHWGFKQVYQGKSGDGLNGFTPVNGDIAVIAGIDYNTSISNGIDVKTSRQKAHGHIQIYYNGVWCSSYKEKDAWCYNNDKGRPYVIFRHPNSIANSEKK